MLAIMPKHKGTDKLQADLRAKISKLNKLMQKKPSKRESQFLYHIDKEGAGQVVLVGMPNVGKSQILSALTNAHSPSTPYPFSTRKPIPGMMEFEDVKIQLIDTPSIAKGFMEKWLPQLVREADLVALVLDLAQENVIEQIEEVMEIFTSERILLTSKASESPQEKKCLMVGNKNDLPQTNDKFQILRELYGEKFTVLAISALNRAWGTFKQTVFDVLNVIRVYSKEPGKPFKREEPFIMKKGSSVHDLATSIHKDFTHLKFARLWDGGDYSGQRVERMHILKDKDIVELHL